MFTVNRLTEKNLVNRFSITRTETDKMAAKLNIDWLIGSSVSLMSLIWL